MSVKAIFVSALSSAILLGAATPAAARDRTVVVTATNQGDTTRRVTYRDLNLASAPGERTLAKRVGHAVSRLCFDPAGGSRGDLHEAGVCRSAAWDGAQPQIDRAVRRAREIAANGGSAIAPVTIKVGV